MTPTPISDATNLHFCRLFMLNVPVNLTFFQQKKSMSFTEELLYVVVYKIEYFWNWSAHASNHGSHSKASSQVSFNLKKCPITFPQTVYDSDVR